MLKLSEIELDELKDMRCNTSLIKLKLFLVIYKFPKYYFYVNTAIYNLTSESIYVPLRIYIGSTEGGLEFTPLPISRL